MPSDLLLLILTSYHRRAIMRKGITLIISSLIVVVLLMTFFTATLWAEDDVNARLSDLVRRVTSLEDKVASAQIPAVTLAAGPDGYYREGTGNWVGKIDIDTNGVRIFQVAFLDSGECGSVSLLREGGTADAHTVFYSCFAGIYPSIGGKVMNFQAGGNADEAFPLGEYSLIIEAEGRWEILVPAT